MSTAIASKRVKDTPHATLASHKQNKQEKESNEREMGGACPSTLRPRGKDAPASSGSTKAPPSVQFLAGGHDSYSDTSYGRGFPIAEVEEGSVRLGLGTGSGASDMDSSGFSTKRGKLNVWSAGYGSVPKTVEMTSECDPPTRPPFARPTQPPPLPNAHPLPFP